jgi:hypothetical protein
MRSSIRNGNVQPRACAPGRRSFPESPSATEPSVSIAVPDSIFERFQRRRPRTEPLGGGGNPATERSRATDLASMSITVSLARGTSFSPEGEHQASARRRPIDHGRSLGCGLVPAHAGGTRTPVGAHPQSKTDRYGPSIVTNLPSSVRQTLMARRLLDCYHARS